MTNTPPQWTLLFMKRERVYAFICDAGDTHTLLTNLQKAVQARHAVTADEIAEWKDEFLRDLRQHATVVVDLDCQSIFVEEGVVLLTFCLLHVQEEKSRAAF